MAVLRYYFSPVTQFLFLPRRGTRWGRCREAAEGAMV